MDQYNSLVKEGLLGRAALETVGVSRASIDRWRLEFRTNPIQDQPTEEWVRSEPAIDGEPKQQLGERKMAKKSKKGKRYSQEEKKTILEKYNSLRNAGTNAYDAAKKVGISYITIRSWEKKEGLGRRSKGSGGTKLAQKITSSSGGLALVLPNGPRIEGLTVEQAIKIIKSV